MLNDFTIISGRHAIEDAIEQHVSIEKIFLARSIKGEFEKYLRQTSRERNIPLSYVEKQKLDKLSRSNHQGVIAYITPIQYYNYEDFIPHTIEQDGHPLLLMLDGITDVRNIGAIARSAEVLGASGMILPTERTALINEFAIKSSAGALLTIPICRTHSLINTTDYLLGSGFTVIGLDGHVEKNINEMRNSNTPLAVILGDEEKGIRKPLLAKCHAVYRIPQVGQTESLNVSVAAGIALYQIGITRKTITR